MTSGSKPLLVLVDGSSFLYRAYHALPPLTSPGGEPTGAVLGVANMLRKLMADYVTPHMVVIFDAPGPGFREAIYPDYKAHRPPMPDDLRQQIAPLHALISAMGLPMLAQSGVEADDVIATLALRAAEHGYEVIISTGDKDLAQLVRPGIILENTMTDTRMDREGVMARFGVPPERIVDYLALVGDSADNIPGIPKVGPKTAAKWLLEYGDLDGLMRRADEVAGKVGESLRMHLEQLPMARTLATLRCDLALPEVASLCAQPPDNAQLRELLSLYGFRSWLRQLEGDTAGAVASVPPLPAVMPEPSGIAPVYDIILEQAQWDAWLARLSEAALFAFDTETDSLDSHEAQIIGLSFAIRSDEACYVPLAHAYPGVPPQLSRDVVLADLRPLLEDESRAKVGQHLKYDANVLANHHHGIILRGMRHDTMLESYVLDSTATRHDMDSLAAHYLARQTIRYEDLTGKGKAALKFAEVPIDQAGHYAAEDAEVTLALHQTLWPRLQQEEALCQLYTGLEMPLVPVLAAMERRGVLIDADLLHIQSAELAGRLAILEHEAHAMAGQAFNLGSPRQLQTLLYEKLELPVLKKTPGGQPSTDESVLQDLADMHPLPRLLLEHRTLSKLKSTYTDRLPLQMSASGRLHTSYHQAVTATGRLSSSDPNLQNIPIRSEAGRRIRQAFIAPPGYRLLAADYSQIELRIMAHLSADPGLLAAFAAGGDVHRSTAAEILGVPQAEVTLEQRRSAKAINFGLIYGMSAFGLARQLGVPQKEAQAYMDVYFQRYPGVREYMESTRTRAKTYGYVETLFGRRLHVPDINARQAQRRQYAERTAINAPMQGSAADIIKRAMLAVDAWIASSGLDVHMIMQVHDELVFEVRDDHVVAAREGIILAMSAVADLAVPLLVEAGTGLNWDEAH